ncbi:sigma-70 family RNA polymerase sigma factor [Candidatus Poribacteria bacterium]|nr:sigma-70 family RNA polymerase sigma factor [Candidatus Poribacteria bacterium]
MKCEDANLIQQTLDGDEQAFSKLVEKYQKQIHALAWQKIGDFHTAQEIAQDTFLTAHQKLASLKHYKSFSGWLYVIADRKCKNWHRKNKLTLKSLEDLDPIELEEVYYSEYMTHQREETANRKRRALVQKLLSKLQESERTVMNLYYIAEMTCEEIAKFLGISPNAVRTRLHRARKRLKEDESVIKENLNSFTLPTQLTENIMQRITNSTPITPTVTKPLIPLAISTVSAIIAVLLIGAGVQHLPRFQQPYNLNAQSEQTIEVVEAPIVIQTQERPTLLKKPNHTQKIGKVSGAGQKPNASLFGVAHADEGEISKQNQQWIQTKGPEGGTVSTLFKSTRGDVFAGTLYGLYRLTDDGTAWQFMEQIHGPTLTRKEVTQGWWHIAERNDKLFIATDTEIITSTDRGTTWVSLCKSREGTLIGMALTDGIPPSESSMTIYLAYADGIFRSVDSGETWEQLTKGLIDRKITAIAAIENVVFAGTDEGLFRLNKDDWEIQTIHRPNIGNIILRKKDSILAMVTSGEYLYVLSGKRDHMVSNPDSSNYRYIVKGSFRSDWLDLSDVKADHWMSGGLSLFRVYDKGNSYEHISPKIDSTKQTVEERDSSRSATAVALKDGNVWIKEMDKTVKFAANKDRILVMQSSQDFYSNDAGDTWRTLKETMEISTDAVMLDDNTFLRCGSYGIQRSTDGGKSWNQFNTGMVNSNIQQLIATDGMLYVNTQSQLVYSSDGGETWLPISEVTEQLPRITHTNGKFYARKNISGNPKLFTLSKDYKLSEISNVPNLMKHLDISNKELNIVTIWTDLYRKMLPDGDFAATDSAYFILHNKRLYRWNIGSFNWYVTGITTRFGTVSIEFAVSGKRVYVGKSNGRLIQSNDEGTTWTNITDHLPFKVERYKDILFAENTVYIATDKGVVMSENGTDWQILTDSEGTAIEMNKLTVDGTKVFGEFEQKIYQRNANNGKWEQITPEIGYYVNCLDVDGNMLYVGTNGKGVLRYALDQ